MPSMSHILHRQMDVALPVAASGRGSILRDVEGNEYIDACGGAAVSCLGHGHPEVLAAMREQMGRLEYAHTSFFTTEVAERLADHLVAHAPPGVSHAYLVCDGSEAMEAALKLARQYFVERGEPQRRHFIARRQSYHGNTLGALAVGGNAARRERYAPLLMDVTHVSPCYAYRDRGPGESSAAYAARLSAELDDAIEALGPASVIGFVAEPIAGATLGAVPAVPGYWQRMREVCDRHGILLIADEVMCGMGRCGTLHALPHEGVVADLTTLGKGLSGGYAPLGAVLVQARVAEAIRQGSGAFQHGHTYVGHPVACAAALSVQTILHRDRLVERARCAGRVLRQRLEARFTDHPHVGDIRGRGLLQGIELVRDRGTRAPFDPAAATHARIRRAAMQRGLLVYPMGGTIDGVSGDHVVLAPAFDVTEDELDAIVQRLAAAFEDALRFART